MSLTDRICEAAHNMGFDMAGIAPAGAPRHAEAFRLWLDRGFSADMKWMGRDPGRLLPTAGPVVVVGLSYFVEEPPPEIWNDPLRGRIARYAWGRDYHEVMLPMLRELGVFVARETGADVRFRACVDTGPILERDAAERAGLGFVGKNTNLISRPFGSYLFLGEILVDRELGPPISNLKSEIVNPCASCRRCLNACPTGALVEPYVLDARRCISYLTIEHRDAISEDLRPLLGHWIFGCDECQQVCPWVIQFSRPGRRRFLGFDPNRCAPRLADLLALDEAAFRERFAGTPVLRAKRSGLLRNAAIALGNSADPAARDILERAAKDADPQVREYAAWAARRLPEGGP